MRRAAGRPCRLERRQRSYSRLKLLIERGRRIDPHAGHDRHAGTQGNIVRRIVNNDLHRHALDDLDVVAGRVLCGQQRERGAGPRLDAGNMASNVAVRIGVDRESHELSRPHRVELRLLEIGSAGIGELDGGAAMA
jgi:hypothetical protein